MASFWHHLDSDEVAQTDMSFRLCVAEGRANTANPLKIVEEILKMTEMRWFLFS